jgi:hypothetical protein
VSRKKTHGEVIGAELQEGLTHISNAVAEASRAAAEQLGPRVEVAQKAAGPALEAAQKAVEARVAPKVAVAVATAAPAVGTTRAALAPRVEAAQKVAGPALEAAREAVGTRVVPAVTTAREALAPRVEAAQLAAARAAADLGPLVEAAGKAAQKALNDDVVPRLGAAQTAALAYAVPRVAAARLAVTPVLENARETLTSGVETARGELILTAADVRKRTAKRRRKLEKKAARTTTTVKRKVGVAPEPTRWPWFLAAAAAIAAVVFVVLRRKKSDDDLWPAPAGDGPVPTYREDPVPSSPSDSGKTVSSAQTAPGDATPPDTDLGMQPQQMSNPPVTEGDVPGSATSGAASDAVNTSINAPVGGVSEGPGGVSPATDATNDTDADTGPAGTPLANRGVEPEGGPNPA